MNLPLTNSSWWERTITAWVCHGWLQGIMGYSVGLYDLCVSEVTAGTTWIFFASISNRFDSFSSQCYCSDEGEINHILFRTPLMFACLMLLPEHVPEQVTGLSEMLFTYFSKCVSGLWQQLPLRKVFSVDNDLFLNSDSVFPKDLRTWNAATWI